MNDLPNAGPHPGGVAGALPTAGTPAARVRVAAFALILGKRSPIEHDEIATVSGVHDIPATLDALAATGWIDRDSGGRVTGAAGLSLDHGPHALTIGVHRFRTWCAYDALGIAGALTADATIETQCGWCGSGLRLPVRSGRPQGMRTERLWLAPGGADLRAEFCEPTVLLCSADHAALCSADHDGQGEVLMLSAAAERGAFEWHTCAATAIELGFWEGPAL